MIENLTILLVEDDPDDVELMREALADNGVKYSIEAVHQGDEVLPYLEMCKKLPSVIILDLNIPKLHGRDVLLRLKASPQYARIPVAILTTASSIAERESCLKAGADVFITKPSSVQGFSAMVNSILAITERIPS